MNYQGKTLDGPLVADEKGIAVDASERSGLKKTTRRIYVAHWADVTSVQISQPEPKQIGGSTINGHSVDLTVGTADRHMAFHLKFTDRARVTNQLGRYIAQVEARNS